MSRVDKTDRQAPGTEFLVDEDGSATTHSYQHIRRGNRRVILVPQPSLSDPNDPLLWPRWKKWLVLGNGLFYAFNGAVTGPMMAGGMIQLSTFFKLPLSDLTYSNGATLICQGFGTLFWMQVLPSRPLAVIFGRRPVYLASNFLMCLACIWLAIASETTFTSFILARAFLGLWEAPIEAIVPSTVTDIFYLHERGEQVSYYGLTVLVGNEIGPLVSAFIIQALNMRWAFFIVAMSIGVNMISMAVSMPETLYCGDRPVINTVRTDTKQPTGTFEHIDNQSNGRVPPVTAKKRSFLQDLLYFHSNKDKSLWQVFKRPFILMAYPTVLWSSLVYGMSLSWNVILGATVAQLFSPPPYNFSSGSQGLIFVSPFLGSLVGSYFCGRLTDQVATWFTVRNNGFRDPEMRLPACILAAILTFLGALLSSLTYHYKTHWAGPIVGFGVLSAGAQMGATLAISYCLDCHQELSAESMVTVSCLKSAVAWVWTWCINDWISQNGLLVVFMSIAAINMAVYATTLVFYFHGKSIRSWIHEQGFLLSQ